MESDQDHIVEKYRLERISKYRPSFSFSTLDISLLSF
jgi:hypothetical protein